jgi:hypothetical protein
MMATQLSKSAILLEKVSRVLTLTAFVLAVVAAVAAPLLALSWSHRPFPGFLVEPTLVLNDYNYWPQRPPGLDHPQRVYRIGEVAVVKPSEFDAVLSSRAVGDAVPLLTRTPQGSTHLYPSIALGQFPARDMLRLFWLPYLVGLVYLGIGLWIYAAQGKTRPGRALAFFSVCTALVSLLLFDLSTTHVFPILWTVAVAQIGGALFSLALRFPVEWRPVGRRAWLLGLPYVVSIGLAVWGVLVVNDTTRPWAYISAWRGSYLYAAFAVLLFLGMMFYQARRGETDLVRRQARLILAGSAIAFIPVSSWFVAPLFRVPMPFDAVLFIPGLVIFPLSIGVAILRYRLSEADSLVNRTLVYGVLTAMLAGSFPAAIGLVQKLFVALTGEKSDAAIVITTLIAASLYAPLKGRLERFVSARFREAPDRTRDLRQFGEEVRAFTRLSEPEQITAQLLSEAVASLGAQSGAISLIVNGHLKTQHTAGRWTGEAWLSLPLEYGGTRYGLLFLGPTQDARQYSREEFKVLRGIAGDVARAIHVDTACLRLSASPGYAAAE